MITIIQSFIQKYSLRSNYVLSTLLDANSIYLPYPFTFYLVLPITQTLNKNISQSSFSSPLLSASALFPWKIHSLVTSHLRLQQESYVPFRAHRAQLNQNLSFLSLNQLLLLTPSYCSHNFRSAQGLIPKYILCVLPHF